ncbi:MAG: hypothetical protein JXR75_11355 [Rhodobacteraceae bacterium]|nr:hypothetical protein [Paracoccaceae bacterium]
MAVIVVLAGGLLGFVMALASLRVLNADWLTASTAWSVACLVTVVLCVKAGTSQQQPLADT